MMYITIRGITEMQINKTQIAEKLVFALEGRLDTATAPSLQEALVPAFDGAQKIELDLSKLEYVSSAGLRVLLIGQKTAQEKNASMVLVGVSDEVMEVLEMTGFTNILTIL
jgi:anti-anti-sigma factor